MKKKKKKTTTTTTTSLKFAFFLKGLAHDYGQESKHFPSLYFSQDRLRNVFKDILGSTKVFLDYEHRKLEKRRKVGIFPYSIVHHFGVFSLVKIAQENVFKDILERKKAFLDCKNKKLKKSNNCYFPKRIRP